MAIPKRNFLYFITDVDNRSYYQTSGGIGITNIPTPLKNTPGGWKDIEIAWGTNDKYFSLQRSFTVPLKFVGDGADIVRHVMRNGKGYEAEIYIIILKWSPASGRYELEYKGRIDLSKYQDNPKDGITLNAIDGGILDYLSSRSDTQYDILCDQTSPDYSRVEFDGTLLADKLTYTATKMIDDWIEIPNGLYAYAYPFTFISNSGRAVILR